MAVADGRPLESGQPIVRGRTIFGREKAYALSFAERQQFALKKPCFPPVPGLET